MKRSNLPGLLFVLLGAFGLAVMTQPVLTIRAAQRNATAAVQAAWERARQSGSYRYTADIVQRSIPKPTVTNVGRTSSQNELHIEGEANPSPLP